MDNLNNKQSNEAQSQPSCLGTVMCCASCFKEIPENHLPPKKSFPQLGQCSLSWYALRTKWFSEPIPKDKIDKIRAVLLA